MKIRCGKVRRLLTEYAAGELSLRLAEAVKDHIDICSVCRSEYEQTQRTLQLLEEAPFDVPPERLRGQIQERIANERAFKRPASAQWWRRPVFAGAAAALLLAIGLVAMIFSGGYGPEQGEIAKSSEKSTEMHRLLGKVYQDWDEYLAQTNDVFYKIAVENESDLGKLLGENSLPTQPVSNVDDQLIWNVAMAMELKEALDPVMDRFAFGVLNDVEGVWKQVYDARESLSEGIEGIRERIRREHLLDRIKRLVD